MKNALLSFTIILALCFITSGAWAAPGDSPDDPILISTAEELDNIRNGLDKFYKLAGRIDLSGYLAVGGAGYAKWGDAGWEPIGKQGVPGVRFSGGLDGGGYAIGGLWINRPTESFVGLFGYTYGARIKDLSISVGIIGGSLVGGLVGLQESYVYLNSSIENCTVYGSVTGTGGYIGGLAGRQTAGIERTSIINNCHAGVEVTGVGVGNNAHTIGGLVGHQGSYPSGTSIIANSSATGNVFGGRTLGGLVGYQFAGSGAVCRIDDCYATGAVSADNFIYSANAGGLVGAQDSSGGGVSSITNSYARGDVEVRYMDAGGLLGRQESGTAYSSGTSIVENCYATGNVAALGTIVSNDSYSYLRYYFGEGAGGLIGHQRSNTRGRSSITNSYATGNVSTLRDFIGGLVGYQFQSVITNCFFAGNLEVVSADGVYLGGLVGVDSPGDYGTSYSDNTNNYRYEFSTLYDTVIPAISNDINGIHGGVMSSAEFMTRATYTGNSWPFSDSSPKTDPWYWDNRGFPKLLMGIEDFPFPWAPLDAIPQISITQQPAANTVVTEGGVSGSLRVNAIVTSGAINPQWYINTTNSNTGGTPIEGAIGAGFAIPSTLTAGTYYYYCVLSSPGALPVTSNVATVLVITTPLITIDVQPAAQTLVPVGNYCILTVEANVSYGTLSYQWYRNTTNSNTGGIALLGETSFVYNNPVAYTGVIGTTYYYYCIISATGAESVTTNVAAVTVRSRPNIGFTAQPPMNITVTEGGITESISLTALATQDAEMNYQWYSNTTVNQYGGSPTAVEGAISNVFEIPATLTAAGSPYYYFCEVSAEYAESARSITTTVTVNQATSFITINTHPVNASVTEGAITGNLSVAASVTGGATLTYQWYSNTSNSNTGGEAIEGATSASFPIPTDLIAPLSPYYYYCEVYATGAATVRSNPATVTVDFPAMTPSITINTHPTNASVTEGAITGNLSVAASLTGGATLTYQWYSNTSNSNTGGTVIGGATTASFTIPTTLTAAGSPYYYFCEVGATGVTSVRSNAATVTVNSPTPVITISTHPVNSSVTEGAITGNLSVTASLTGGATLTYQWYSNTSNSNTGGTVIGGATTANFTIPTTLTAAGSPYYYFCEVGATGATSVRSNAATVTVNAAAPEIIINAHPVNSSVTEGAITGNLSVTASVTGGATLTYQWYSNTSNNNTGGTAIGGATTASFTIPTILTAAGSPYFYFCEVGATGATSVRSNAATVTVDPAPEAPTITSANNTTVASSAGGTFQVTATGAAPITFSLSGAPSGVSLNSSSGLMTIAASVSADIYTFTITAANGINPNATQSFTLTVTTESTTVFVTGVNLNKSYTSIHIGNNETLTATVLPADATNKNVTWSSDNPWVATVNANGLVSAIGAGSANITVRTVDGGFEATCYVSATTPVSSVTIDPSTVSIDVGEMYFIMATVEPFNVSNSSLTWSSSNEAVATVTQGGLVRAVGGGTTTITATAADGSGVFDTCIVNVPIYLTAGVTLNKSFTSIHLGSSETLTATVLPTNATNKNVTWSSDNPWVATVDANGSVSAIGGGSANITARTVDGGFESTCYVSVTTPVSGITIDPPEVTIDAGEMYLLMATVEPFNASNSSLTWSSSNEAVATVTQGGLVRAVSAGTTTITATAADGSGVSGTGIVNVTAPVTEATMDILATQFELPAGTPTGIVSTAPIIFVPADSSDISLETDMLGAMMPGIKPTDLRVNEHGAITIEDRIAKEIAKELLGVDHVEIVTIPVFEAVLNNDGEIAAVSFQIKGSRLMMGGLIDKPENARLLSILSGDSGDWFTYTDSSAGLGDKTFTILDMSNNIFTGNFEPEVDYILVLLIKDGGDFDLDGQEDGSAWGISALVGVR